METKLIEYDFEKSIQRIKSILKSDNKNYQKVNSIPARSQLTFNNGFYVRISAIFIDIKYSSKLTDFHNRPTLAKIYRSYISEIVAVLNSFESCREVNIIGDGISGIFSADYKSQISEVVLAAAQINTLLKILNCLFKNHKIQEIDSQIGISFGRALMIKAGFSGSTINDVVWMGNVVNEASNIANEDHSYPIVIDSGIFSNLDHKLSSRFSLFDYFEEYYGADIENIEMNKWYEENCNDNSVFGDQYWDIF